MNYLNVHDFGAKGDGKTDDTVAITKALETVAKENGTLYFPMGNYMIKPLKVPSHITIMGNTAWSGAGDDPALGHTRLTALNGDARALLDLDACIGTRIIGMTLDGKNLGKEMHGIYSKHGEVEQNNCYEDCAICNFTGTGLKMDLVWVFAIRRCLIANNKLHGIDVDNGYDGWVMDNRVENNGLWGINAGPGMVCYTSNTIKGNQGGGIIADDTQNINVTGNNFVDNGGPAIYINKSRASAISGNTLIGNSLKKTELECSSIVVKNSVGISVMGNSVSGTSCCEGNCDAPDYGIVAIDLSDCVISANAMHGCAKKEILHVSGKNNSIIENNTGSLIG